MNTLPWMERLAGRLPRSGTVQGFSAVFQRWLNAGLGLLYPEVCQFCGKKRATPAEGYVCEDCRLRVRFIAPPFCQQCGRPFPGQITAPFTCSNCRELKPQFVRARSAVLAQDLVLEAIHRYKYQRALWLEPFLAQLLLQQAVPELGREHWDCIVPVPLHPAKQRQREFNQAERLARRLSRATAIPLQRRVVIRPVDTETQTRLSRQERQENVRKAFAPRNPEPRPLGRVVLVDDVFTTGATTNACARAVLAAGASSVCVWTVARGI